MTIVKLEILQSAPNDTKPNAIKESGIKGPVYMCIVVLRVPNFRPFHSTLSCFQDIAHLRILQLTSMLKFQGVMSNVHC